MLGERLDVRVEVETAAVVLVLPRRLDDCMVPWEQAMQLGEVLEMAAAEVPEPPIIDAALARKQSSQVRLNTHGRHVVLLFDHTDRVHLCPEAACLLGRALRQKAQDVSLALRDIHLVYGRGGLIRKLVHQRLGYTQHVR